MKLYLLKTENLKLKASRRGFVMLFAVLISSIVLTIAMGLLQIALKELLLSSTGRESQFGFYAADAGVECALYWDVKGNGGVSIFPTSTASAAFNQIRDGTLSGVYCGTLSDGTTRQDIATNRSSNLGSSFVPMQDIGDGSSATTTFYLSVVNGKACATVDVGKSNNRTTIESYGRNTCASNDPRIIERGIRVTY